MTTAAVPAGAGTADLAVADRLRRGYECQDAVGMGALYGQDATWELHIGSSHVVLHGRAAIVERYAADLHPPTVLRRWDVRPASWGAVAEAEAEQGAGEARVRYRWVHLLTVEQGRITRDVLYCSGAVPVPG